MIKLTPKSVLTLPLLLLTDGILAVLLLLPISIFAGSSMHDFLKTYTNESFPFDFGIYALLEAQFVLLIPVLWMAYSRMKRKRTYHGIYMAMLALGCMVKFQQVPWQVYALFPVMALLGIINFAAYLHMRQETIDDWVKYRLHGDVPTRAPAGGYMPSYSSDGLRSADPVTFHAITATKHFNRVVGMEALKARLLKTGQDILADSGARNGILLTGEPGNGKTMMAEALAGTLNIPIINVSIGNFQSMWVGETTQRVMKLFDDAVAQAPCILFIDEIEAVLVNRSHSVGQGNEESPKLVSAMLKRLVDIRGQRVIVMGATNYLDRLDPAAIREGRLDFKIEVPPPDLEARTHLVQQALEQAKLPFDAGGLSTAVRRWEGYSVARMRAIAAETIDQYKQAQSKDSKSNSIGFEELTKALRNLNATMGNRIPEDALTIDQLVLEKDMRTRLKKLSVRMQQIEQIEAMGGSVPRGVLFHGPAGTGKTVAAMALAKATGWAFITTSGHDLLHSPHKMDEMMRLAKDIRPCVVFIDEADDVLSDRRSSPLSKDVTNKLLTLMDGADGRVKDILFIAATNAPDLIDSAMLRGGRFTEKIAFDVPGEQALSTYIKKWMANTKAPLAADFTLDAATQVLLGESLANVGEILQSAINEAISTETNQGFAVSLSHLQQAIRLVKG